MRPTRNFTRSRTSTSYERGSAEATLRTSSMVTTATHGSCEVDGSTGLPECKTAGVRVTELWRHPVKSLQGEQLADARLDPDGVDGDRLWGVRDTATGRVLTARREPRLLYASARVVDDQPELSLPTGDVLRGTGQAADDALSAWLAKPVTLTHAVTQPPAQAEYFADATDDASAPIEWTMPPGRFVDAAALLLLTTASLRTGLSLHPEGDWDVRRFRPNVLIDTDEEGWVEDGWCGRTVRIGEVEVVPQQPCVRCTMVTRPQPGLERDVDTFRTVARHHAGHLGVWSAVRSPGTIRVGDDVTIR